MHGAILHSLANFVTQTHGKVAWMEITRASGMPDAHFVPTNSYPDADAMSLLQAVVEHTGQPVDAVLESFGQFLAPALLSMYGALLDRSWRTLDIVEHTEDTIHRVVRMRNPGAVPPFLQTRRSAADEVVVRYASPRRMCQLAEGIVRGIAAHYGEEVTIAQPLCMHRGDEHCEIVVRRR